MSYDHPHHALLEEAITIDFVNRALGPGARVAVELTLEAAKELSGALIRAIAAGRDRGKPSAPRDLRRLVPLPGESRDPPIRHPRR